MAMLQDPNGDNYSAGADGSVPPGYRRDPISGQLVPIPAGAQQLQPGQPGYDPTTDPSVAQAPGSVTPPGMHWDPTMANFVADAPTTTGPPPGGGGGSGATGTLGGLLAPFTGTFTAPTPTAYPGAPQFHAPGYTPPPAFVPDLFTAPSATDALNDPGYQFAAQQGEQALQAGHAAGGVTNTGGSLKDILAWGQNYAAQRYGDVYNRNYQTYTGNEGAKERAYASNLTSQYLQPYQFAYQGALDTFNPQQSQWQTNMAATQRGNENAYANAYQNFQDSYQRFRDQRDSTFDKTFKYATA